MASDLRLDVAGFVGTNISYRQRHRGPQYHADAIAADDAGAIFVAAPPNVVCYRMTSPAQEPVFLCESTPLLRYPLGSDGGPGGKGG